MVVNYQAYLKCLVKWGTTRFTLQLPPLLLNVPQLLLQRNVIQHFNFTWATVARCLSVTQWRGISHHCWPNTNTAAMALSDWFNMPTARYRGSPKALYITYSASGHNVLQNEKRATTQRPQLVDTPHCQVSYRQNRGTVERLLLPVWYGLAVVRGSRSYQPGSWVPSQPIHRCSENTPPEDSCIVTKLNDVFNGTTGIKVYFQSYLDRDIESS